VKLYIEIACGFVVQVECCEGIYWEFVWFGGTGITLRMYIVEVRLVWWNS